MIYLHIIYNLVLIIVELFEGVSSYNRPRMKSSPVSPPMEITLFAEEVRLLRTFQTEMERIGIRFVISDSARACDETLISVHGVPSVFVEREVSEVNAGDLLSQSAK